MTRLRKMMVEELERRNYSQGTTRCYDRAVADFARYFHHSPDQLRPEHVREYQAYLFRERKLDARSATQQLAALGFQPSPGCPQPTLGGRLSGAGLGLRALLRPQPAALQNCPSLSGDDARGLLSTQSLPLAMATSRCCPD